MGDVGGSLARMSTRRRWFLNVVFAILIGGSLYDIITDQEHWPFSQYPMFSAAWHEPTFTWLRVFGVTADAREFPLDSNRYVSPFDQSRLQKALRKLTEDPRRLGRVDEALADLLARYRKLEDAGTHDGPPLVALRLYELKWTIDPEAANVDHPDGRRLIAEVRQP